MEFFSDLNNEAVAPNCDNDMYSERTNSSGPPSPNSSTDLCLKSSRGKRKIDRSCAVCGDKALGCNFDAVTCESCKAFFRRNALKDEVPKCIFDRQCKVDVNTRRFCTYCRLQKCINVGMKRDMILDDDQKRQRMEKVRQNRQRRQGGPKTPSATSDGESCVEMPALVGMPTMVQRPGIVIGVNKSLPSSSSSSSASSVPSESPISNGPTPTTVISTEVLDAVGTTFSISQIDLSTMAAAAVKSSLPLIKADADWKSPSTPSVSNLNSSAESGGTEYGYETAISAAVFSGGDLPTNSLNSNGSGGPHMLSINESLSRRYMARLLTQEEWNAVSDLTEAYKSSFLETTDKAPEGKCSLINLVNTSGFIVRKLITFAKKLSDFTNLPQGCQIALLKGVVLNTLFLRSATHYDPDKNVWITPRGEVPASILQEATGYRDLYEEHGKFCRQFLMTIDKDENLVPLIQVLTLFSPDRPQLGDQHQHVSDIQDRYVCLTKHYLEARRGYAISRRRFHQVLKCMEALQDLTDSHGKVLLHIDPDEVDPLMLEVFDLKTTFLHDPVGRNLSDIQMVTNGIFSNVS